MTPPRLSPVENDVPIIEILETMSECLKGLVREMERFNVILARYEPLLVEAERRMSTFRWRKDTK